MTDFVNKVKEFNTTAGTLEEFNPRKCALYTGLILEEVEELLEAYNAPVFDEIRSKIVMFANGFKAGAYDKIVENGDRVGILDAAVDIAVVAVGQAISVGSDAEGACNHVADNNLTKFPLVDGVRTVLKDANGKVKKPADYVGPQLEQFLV